MTLNATRVAHFREKWSLELLGLSIYQTSKQASTKDRPPMHFNTYFRNGARAKQSHPFCDCLIIHLINPFLHAAPVRLGLHPLPVHAQFIRRHSQLPALFHKVLAEPHPSNRHRHCEDLCDLLTRIDADLQRFEGPYLCGTQFTLADAYIYPVIERVVSVLPLYRGFWIPPSLRSLVEWYDAASDRPAVRAASGDRTAESAATYCFESMSRDDYLAEAYEPLARGEAELFGRLNAEFGAPGTNVYRQDAEESQRDRSVCERKSCTPPCVIS